MLPIKSSILAVDNSFVHALLPIRAVTIVMRFQQASSPGFFHQAALTAWLRILLDSPEDYELYLTIDATEQGKTHFKAGDDYHFTVIYSGSLGETYLLEMIQRLQSGEHPVGIDERMPFRNNWHLLHCLPSTWGIQDSEALEQQIACLRQQPCISIHMTSPWRMLQAKTTNQVTLSGEYRFCHSNEQIQTATTPLWLMRMQDSLADLLRRRGCVAPSRGAAVVEATAKISWVDSSYKNKQGRQKPMGGLLGDIQAIQVQQMSEEQCLALVLGQYLGVGQRRAFGLGRYQILDANHESLFPFTVSKDEPKRDESTPPISEVCSLATDEPVNTASAMPFAPYQDTTRLLIVCGEPTNLSLKTGRLCVEREATEPHYIPWTQLDAVVMLGRHQITTPALKSAMKHHVPIHMASASGAYIGVASSGKAGVDQSMFWLKQSRRFEQEAWSLTVAKSIVDARIRHIMESLRRRTRIEASAWKSALKTSLQQVQKAANSQVLMGVEGHAAQVYFGALKAVIPEAFQFTGRNRRPPRDPLNALFSLGFTYLYAVQDSLLRADGFLPVMGVYHQSHGSHAALASDLMEPFRHVVEREAVRLIRNQCLKVDDFTHNEQGCWLSASARRTYMGALSKVFLKPSKARGGNQALTIFEHLHQQNLALKRSILDKNIPFEAWRMR